MSLSNENNRPQSVLGIGAVSATVEKGLLLADKAMTLKKVSLVDISAVAASGTNYVQAQLKKNGTLIGAVVDTQAGLTAREALELDLGDDAELEAGDFLSLQLTVAASGELTEASAHVDYQVK